jgi:hypothetical protein
MRSVLIIMALAVVVSFAVVPPPEHCLLKYDSNYPQLSNVMTAFTNLTWPHTDFAGATYPGFWTAVNDGTQWDIIAMDCTYNSQGTITDFANLINFGTAHPDCRILYFGWANVSSVSGFWAYFDITGVSNILGTSVPPSMVWDADSPVFDGMTPPPTLANPGLNVVAHNLTWVAAKATSDVPLGWTSATTTNGQGAWVFSRKPGTADWQRPRAVWLGFSPGMMNTTDGPGYYQNILEYMWNEEETNPRVEATSLGNVKALYR